MDINVQFGITRAGERFSKFSEWQTFAILGYSQIAERFSKVESIPLLAKTTLMSDFSPTQMIALLAHHEGDEEEFIAEKAD